MKHLFLAFLAMRCPAPDSDVGLRIHIFALRNRHLDTRRPHSVSRAGATASRTLTRQAPTNTTNTLTCFRLSSAQFGQVPVPTSQHGGT